MSLQTSTDATRAKETLSLVGRARAPLHEGTDSLALSILSAREAVARSQLNDNYAATAAIARARDLLALGRTGHEPPAWNFWGPADLAMHEMSVAVHQRNGRRAEKSVRQALAHVDPVAFPRNSASYSASLAQVLATTRQFDEAVTVASTSIDRLDSVRGSRRIRNKLAHTLDALRDSGHKPAQEFADAAGREPGRGRQ